MRRIRWKCWKTKDTLEMLEELIENSDTERIDRKKLLDIIRRSPDMFFEDD